MGYLGHDPELFSASIAENILLSSQADPEKYLRLVCLDQKVAAMPDGTATRVGTGGVRLSGGQAQRLALARTLCHKRPLLSLAILAAVAGAIGAALVPPLVLGRIVDALVNGQAVPLSRIALYFAFIALTGALEAIQESPLTVFGLKVTHALRSRLMEKQVHLTTDTLNRQEPGILVSRFVGDVDTVENLFTSGIISMAADVCKLLSILAVVWSCNRGLAYVLLALLPLLFVFTRSVQKRMLAAQLANRQVVGRASGYVPETLHNIRTIHSLGKENYMEQRYDPAIGESYRAIERTNFYDAVYSPVVLTLNAVVVAVVMLLSASGSPAVLTLFGMSAGTAVTVINYISQIFSPVESLGMEIQTIQSAASRSFWHRANFPHSLPPR